MGGYSNVVLLERSSDAEKQLQRTKETRNKKF